MKKIKYGHVPTLISHFIIEFIASGIYAFILFQTGQLTDLGMAKDLTGMLEIAKMIAGLGLVMLVVNLLTNYFEYTYIQKSMKQLKHHFIDDVLKQDIIDLQKDKVPVLLSNLTNDFDRYETKYIKNMTFFSWAIGTFMWSMVLIGTINRAFAVVPVILLFVFYKYGQKSSQPVKEKEEIKSDSLKEYTDYINETVLGYEVIKQHQLEETREERFVEHAVEVQKDNYQVDVATTKVEGKSSFLGNFLVYSLVVIGMIVAVQSDVSLGNMVVVIAAFSMVLNPMTRMSTALAEMNGVQDVLKSFNEKFEVKDHQRTQSMDHFESLSFNMTDLGYEDETILKDVEIDVKRKEKILIVGPSGAGKSTILKTIRQTTPPLTNSVTLNGIDISSIVPIDYYSLFSTVDQIGFLFSGQLKDNITLYQEVDENKVMTIMDEVGLGYLDLEMDVQNDGGNLSGGQRARVLLARALALESQVIVCDEIFASLDAEVARAIESDLLKLDQTIINVSHIFFNENLEKYDKIYIVENSCVHLASTLEEVQVRMLEFQRQGES